MICIRTALLLLVLTRPLLTWAIDLQPNDIVAPLPNKNYVTVSYLNTENNTLYRNGSVASSNPIIDTQSAIFVPLERMILAACQQPALFSYLSDLLNQGAHWEAKRAILGLVISLLQQQYGRITTEPPEPILA